jgi:CubicO group peptidase (beta-lactamase class C family)
MVRWFLISVCVLAFAGCSAPRFAPFPNAPSVKQLDGSTIVAAEIDAAVNRVIRAAKVTGLGLALFNDRKIVYLKTYGLRDRQRALPLTQDSVMSAASFSKVTFAYMVMQLVQEGRQRKRSKT